MNNVQYNSLSRLGYSGALNDMLLTFYRSYVGDAGSLPDAEYKFLAQRGFTQGSINDRWYALLRSYGYTGSITEMMYRWWSLFPGSSLALDFLSSTDTLDPRITFSRASTATRINASGALESVAIDGPRFDYDPVTLQPKGLLIEEQRTNLAAHSGNVSSATWAQFAVVLASGQSAPDSGFGAALATADGTNAAHWFTSSTGSLSYTSGVTYTNSVYLKPSGSTLIQVAMPSAAFGALFANFELTGGGAVLAVSANTTATITPAGNGWYRCAITAVATATSTTNGNVVAFIASESDARLPVSTSTGSVLVWGGQVEVGAFATSYIPTTTAAATRAADVAVMTGANFSNWYRQDEGTLFAEGSIPFVGGSTFPAFASVDDGTSSNAMEWSMWDAASDSVRFAVWNGGVNQASIVAGTYTAAAALKLAGTYKVNDFAASYNGASAVTDTAGTLPTVTVLRIGQNRAAGNPLNGHIRKIAYFPRRLSNSELQGVTS